MYINFRWLCTALLLLAAVAGQSQESDFNTRFAEALKLQEENEQSQAAQIWFSLAKTHSDNGNINYRAGLAHINSGGNKTAALPFLKRALELGINKNYDRFSPQETKSPLEVHYYIGRAYHLNNKFDEAIESYKAFKENASPKHFLQLNSQLGIKQAENAKVLTANPVDYAIVNLGPTINSEYPDFSPVISVDENALFFTSSRVRPDSSNLGIRDRLTGEYFNDIYVSYKDRQGAWQTPELLEINAMDHTATVNVSADGQMLYMYRDDDGIGNIYESKLVGETWSEPVKMGGGINSKQWDTHIAVTVDGETAYFVSNRSGGFGGRDIYRVRKLPTGDWSAAQNLGGNINTQYEEDAVFISADGQTMYFSSEGHSSMGGFDVFYSAYDEETDTWGKPVNIGYPINTADDDVFFVTSADGRRAYYSSIKDEGYGEKDIYMVNLPSPREVKMALLMGKIFTADMTPIPDLLNINVTNMRTRRTDVYTPRSRDGGFVAILPPCDNYLVEYLKDGLVLATDTFTIDCKNAYQEINKELVLNPLRIERDGTATVVRSDDGELIVSSTTGDNTPATFKRFFGYNENAVALEEDIFTNFMRQVSRRIDTNGSVDIEIVGSASTVPTRTYGSNEKLAQIRANKAKERILAKAKYLQIDEERINFKSVEHKVSGPRYKGDFKEGEENYKQYQYIDIKAN